VAGRINEEDLETIRDRARIDDIVREFVALRPAGAGTLKGLCPFHDEKTPSFQVTTTKGLFYCFGCGEGGDVIKFVERINNMGFADAVAWLADKVGVILRVEDVPGGGPRVEPGLRMRTVEANRLAEEFFTGRLATPDAVIARRFLDGRGFDRAAAESFGCGFAPTDGKALLRHLTGRGFGKEELVRAGLVREAGWDFFQGRLVWPIRDAGRTTLGFGARRLFDDDRMPAKYLNTPETILYKKAHVLYGLDLARTHIGKKNQAVVVEGYTDVMACHLAGVDTAVATCGTAFGSDHSRIIHRLMTSDSGSEVIFTFDGDAAGQAAALKAFKEDAVFGAQTYVAVEPSGLDPCDLRLQQGDAAVRELVARRQPLYRFVMKNIVGKYDLDRVEGRLGAVREAAPLVKSVRDAARVSGYLRELAGMVGMDDAEVRVEVARVNQRRPAAEPTHPADADLAAADTPTTPGQQHLLVLPDPRDRRLEVERGVLQLVLQEPGCFDALWYGLLPEHFQHPTYRYLFEVVAALDDRSRGWAQRLADLVGDPVGEQLIAALSVEPLLHAPSPAYAARYAARLRLLAQERRIAQVKSWLQRTNPVDDQRTYNRGFVKLLEFEAERRRLQAEALGDE